MRKQRFSGWLSRVLVAMGLVAGLASRGAPAFATTPQEAEEVIHACVSQGLLGLLEHDVPNEEE